MRKIVSGFVALGMLLFTNITYAADVTITINGKVVAEPCSIATTTANVDLGNLSTTALATAGSYSDWKSVTLNLTNCPVGTNSVVATFSGTSDSSGSYFLNQGTAGNLSVQLADSGGKNITNGSTLTSAVSESTQATAFNLEVRAISPDGGTTLGTIQSVVNVTYTWQ